MQNLEHIDCQLLVIGAGMAGMSAGLFAAQNGLHTVVAGSAGESIFASGLLDLMGVYPLEDQRLWADPWAAVAAATTGDPRHPYARLTSTAIRKAFDGLLDFLASAGLPYRRRNNQNVDVITAVGSLKRTYAVPQTMWAGIEALEKQRRGLIVDIRGLKGFSARQVAATLAKRWPRLKSARVSFPGTDTREEVYGEHLARSLALADTRQQLADDIRPHLGGAAVVGMPALLGVDRAHDIARDLAHRIGVPIFEIPTIPPSVPGVRLKETFEQNLPPLGVRLLLNRQVHSAEPTQSGGFRAVIGREAAECTVHADGIVLATGRYLGGGLRADRSRIRETVFGLPVYQPGDRSGWHHHDFLDPRGHPVNRAGLETDRCFRPLGADGNPAHPSLFAAGAILAHQDWVRMKCGAGLAAATAYGAVKTFAGQLQTL